MDDKVAPPPSYNAAPPNYDASQYAQQQTLAPDMAAGPSAEKEWDAVSTGSQAPGFNPTIFMDVQTVGFNMNSLSNRNWRGNNAIPVFRLIHGVHPSAPMTRDPSGMPEYLSVRPKISISGSNSCALLRCADSSETPVMSTIYRMGPGRDPHIRIFGPHDRVSIEDSVDPKKAIADEIEVKTRWITSRSADFKTTYGHFEWRYGSRSEKKEHDASSLLVLDQLDSPRGSSSKGKGQRIAQMVRNKEFRTEGSTRWDGGNGGRLMIDLSDWAGQEKSGVVEQVEALVVASLILMLKRETDRAKDNQMASFNA